MPLVSARVSTHDGLTWGFLALLEKMNIGGFTPGDKFTLITAVT